MSGGLRLSRTPIKGLPPVADREQDVRAAPPTDPLRPPQRPWRDSGLAFPAKAYLLSVLALAVGLAAHLLINRPTGGLHSDQWALFAVLAGAAALAQSFVVITPRNQSYHASIAFVVPAALLLPAEFLPLLAFLQHVPEWLRQRYAWYIQSFNVANYALDALLAAATAHAILGTARVPSDHARTALAWLAAASVFVVANHVLLALMLRLGRGHSWRRSGLFTFESLSADLVLATVGVVLAGLWDANRWLAVFGVAPLLLIHRSLTVPVLEAQVRIDPKTGLYNARHFGTALTEELGRAMRFRRPLSLLMVDLDLLRNINNSYGHLAGDAVLRGIADVFRQELREFDIAARFGGEEFSIILPETSKHEATAIAERIRIAVARTPFEVDGSTTSIPASVSIGVATRGLDATDAYELIRAADVAVYAAKRLGRNRVVEHGASELRSIPFDESRSAMLVERWERDCAIAAPDTA